MLIFRANKDRSQSPTADKGKEKEKSKKAPRGRERDRDRKRGGSVSSSSSSSGRYGQDFVNRFGFHCEIFSGRDITYENWLFDAVPVL